jgi:hypothetical protein
MQIKAAERQRSMIHETNVTSIHILHLRVGSQAYGSSPGGRFSLGYPEGRCHLSGSHHGNSSAKTRVTLILVAPLSGEPVSFRLTYL